MQKPVIQVNLHYIPVYRQPYYERFGFKQGYCAEAEKYHQDGISDRLSSWKMGELNEVVVMNILLIGK